MSFGPKPDEPIRINSGPAPRSWDQPAVDAQKAAMWEAAFYAERTKFAAETKRCADLSSENAELQAALAEAREQVAQLTAERDAMRQALEALATHAYSHRDELTDLLDNHAVRLATGETCVLGMPMTCSDAHSAGHCAKPRGAVTNTTAVGIPVIGEVDARSCPAHGCPRVLCECPPARDEASGTTAGGDDR